MTVHDAPPMEKTASNFMPAPCVRRRSSFHVMRDAIAAVRRGWEWFARHKAVRLDHDRLRVTDRVSVGEKSYVCVVQVDGQRFLIGGTPAAFSLLAELKSVQRFPEALKASTNGAKPRSRKKVAGMEGSSEGHL